MGLPRVPDAVAALRRRQRGRVVVASYLLSEAVSDRLRDSGADVVTEPLGTHPGLVRLIANRFRRALVRWPPEPPSRSGADFHVTSG